MISLKGAEVSAHIKGQVAEILGSISGETPCLAIVRVGERPDDISYERGAVKKMESFGLRAVTYSFPGDISDEAFCREFEKINQDALVDGILLLRPLPSQIDEAKVVALISPDKDLDGISPASLGKVFVGDETGFAPCTAEAVVEILKYNRIDLAGRHVVIIGRSLVVGKPLTMLMLAENATVTVCHSKTENLPAICRSAQILVAAVGRAKMVKQGYVAEGAIVVDVGINVDEEGRLCGDVDFDDISKKALMATPVPGGIGAVTTAILARHLVETTARLRPKR